MRFRLCLSLLLVMIVSTACAPGQLLGPTLTLTPTITPTATATLTPTPTETPTLTPTPIVYDGDWKGMTKLGWPLAFTVDNRFVVKFDVQFGYANCHVEIQSGPDTTHLAIEKDAFAFIGDTMDFEGRFLSATEATGILKATSAQCGDVDTTWKATRK
jgi:hypothetical protein